MSIEIVADEDTDLALFTLTGQWDTEEVIRVLDAYYGGSPRRDALWDLRDASLSELKAQDFARLAERGAHFAPNRGPGARTAVIVTERMSEMLVEAFCQMVRPITPVTFAHFLNPDDARAWLSEER